LNVWIGSYEVNFEKNVYEILTQSACTNYLCKKKKIQLDAMGKVILLENFQAIQIV